jgi:hypothetical protein
MRTRNPAEIGQRAVERRTRMDANLLRSKYRDVFGYRPDLGEPEQGRYWIYGWLWSYRHGELYVHDPVIPAINWHVPSAAVFGDLVAQGRTEHTEHG